jgi:hypothetical protein
MVKPPKVMIKYRGNSMGLNSRVHCNNGKVKENGFDVLLWLATDLLQAC